MIREQRVAATFVDLADSLVADFDVVDLMVLPTERCVELLDASAAGLLPADPGGSLRLVAATSEAVETVELFPIQHDEGPCYECYRTGSAVSSADLVDDDDRRPGFAPVALNSGYHTVHALPLRLRGTVLGALNLFHDEPTVLSRADTATAQALADIATISLLQSRAIHDSRLVAEQLQEALDSRIVIEQAKGIIAEGLNCAIDEAFRVLRRHTRAGGLRLGAVAQQVVGGSLRPQEIVRR